MLFLWCGSRYITEYGKKYCTEFCKEFSLRDIPVVSGLAVGSDTIAHKTAIEYGGKTIAVLPSGLKNVYPKVNSDLFEEIIENDGLVVTEYENDKMADSNSFLARNRIVVALGEALLVIEAQYRSGTSVTAKIAEKNDKKIFALPRKFG